MNPTQLTPLTLIASGKRQRFTLQQGEMPNGRSVTADNFHAITDLIKHIFLKLDLNSLRHCSSVCKLWDLIFRSSEVYRYIFAKSVLAIGWAEELLLEERFTDVNQNYCGNQLKLRLTGQFNEPDVILLENIARNYPQIDYLDIFAEEAPDLENVLALTTQLRGLRVDYSGAALHPFSTEPLLLSHMTTLRELSIIPFTKHTSENIFVHLVQLTHLYVDLTDFEHKFMDELSRLTDLESLSVIIQEYSDTHLHPVPPFPQLRKLHLCINNPQRAFAASLLNCTTLTTLTLTSMSNDFELDDSFFSFHPDALQRVTRLCTLEKAFSSPSRLPDESLLKLMQYLPSLCTFKTANLSPCFRSPKLFSSLTKLRSHLVDDSSIEKIKSLLPKLTHFKKI